MFTDIVGYSTLTQKNEALALDLLEEHFKLLRAIFPRFGGKEIKTIGDSFLVEFASVLEAVRAAKDIQDAVEQLNKSSDLSRRVRIRIGVHLGDVIHRGGDVFGDGVNIASRIERFAEPGGICVSEDVYNQVRRREEFNFVPLGEKRLKNIETPLALYKILGEGEKATVSFFRQTVGLRPAQANWLVGSMTSAALAVFVLSLYWSPNQSSAAGAEQPPVQAGARTAAPASATPPEGSRGAGEKVVEKTDPGSRTVPAKKPKRRRAVATLTLKGIHDLREGTLYLFADGELMKSVDLRRGKDEPGNFESSVTLPPGNHDLEIRVRSSASKLDISEVVSGEFKRNQTRTLLIRLTKGGGFLGLGRRREMKVEWLD